ncbi:MAG: sigma 54-interacting transcriptional regulator, partial [Myxococcota bacterium]|nr:sigma 54-interacting transcriptional regulator [Myxococcota bacterium]
MTHDATTVDGTQSAQSRRLATEITHPALVLVWSRSEPERVGEVLLVEKTRQSGPLVLGRGEGAGTWSRQRPGQTIATGPLADPKLSRRQLEITPGPGGGLRVANVGRGQLLGTEGDASVVYPGQTVGIAGRALWLVTERPAHLPGVTAFPQELWPVFGAPDVFGMVGESPACWRLREALGRAAAAPGHLLIMGPSGTGKELAAKAIHGLSDRRRGPYVTRNAAAIPEGLVAAELFGNLAGYPNPGTPARDGLVGAAHGGFLLLDEVGELSAPAQAALLRVLDTDGEYQRLGESKARRSDLRVLGATH